MDVVELNMDGLVGPTHHYAGLATGNIASTSNAYITANPAAAARQGIEKMRFLHRLGLKQALLPPHARPNLMLFRQLGFHGSLAQQLNQAKRASPGILTACYSASSMWTANAATITPSTDTADGLVHFTAANLVSQLHRHQEADFSHKLLQSIFSDQRYFKHHSVLPQTYTLGDEGAANHNRLCEHHGSLGLHLFVYGRQALGHQDTHLPTRYPARQTREASEAIARRHLISPKHAFFARQNSIAIDAGVFHHDVIGVANESLILIHEDALVDQTVILDKLSQQATFPLHIIEIAREQFTLEDAVNSYIFNSQLLTLPTTKSGAKSMLLLAPKECEMHPRVHQWIDELVQDSSNPVTQVNYFDLKQSMQNGGGPACLRLRVPLNTAQLKAMHQHVLMDDEKLDALDRWVSKHYRTELSINDLADPQLLHETFTALDELTQLLHLGSIYPFQCESMDSYTLI
jgi:succinylarginine dihydrolase